MTASDFPTDQKQAAHDAIADASDWLDLHGDALYRYARSRVRRRELAEDLVQETFLTAMTSRASFRAESTARTWLISTLRRKIVDYYRHRSAVPVAEPASFQSSSDHARIFTPNGKWKRVPTPWNTSPDVFEAREFWIVFSACLSQLPSALANTFVLREIEGMEIDELRETFSLSPGNVRVRLHRARQLLRECLERNWFGEDSHEPTSST